MIQNSIVPTNFPNFTEYGAPECSKVDPEIFFPEDRAEGASPATRPVYLREREAKLTCMDCPYKRQCLEYAIKNPDLQGIWGGFTETERRKLRNRSTLIGARIVLPPKKHS